jgi:hypothetical protein
MGAAVILGFFWGIGGIVYAIVAAGNALPARRLRRGFGRIGDPCGRTMAEIIAVVGQPHSSSDEGEGRRLCQWIVPDYHVALMFQGELCERVVSVIKG